MRYKEYLNESSLSRIMQHIQGSNDFGVMSPFRDDNTDAENEQKYKKLIKAVRKMGYGFIPLKGGYQEESGFVNEKSLFIPGIKRNEIIELGKEYKQYSIIHKDSRDFSEIGTNESAGIGKKLNTFKTDGKGVRVDDIGTVFTDFFSKLVKGSHKGKKFLFVSEEQTGSMFVGSRVIERDIFEGCYYDVK